jgi:uncharacterized membrane protein YphA (DoxX/SURF4 family)
MTKGIIVDVISILLILLFGYAATSKLITYNQFVWQIAKSPILKEISPYLALVVPIIEFTVCIMLVIPKWRLKGLYGSITLMIIFTLYIAFILTFSKHVPCNCGGVLQNLRWKNHLIFNICFLGLSFSGIFLENKLNNIKNNNIQKSHSYS